VKSSRQQANKFRSITADIDVDQIMEGKTYMARKALITGITGQDGSYLAEFLLGKGGSITSTPTPTTRARACSFTTATSPTARACDTC